jgi:fatty acid desaturase
LEAFFFAPLHFNFHAEHHLYPGIPFDKLPEAHRLLAGQQGYREAISIERGYLRFLLRHGIRRAPVAATGSFVSS